MVTPKFRKGDIIVQNAANCTSLFAVYGGIVYKSNEKPKKAKKAEVDFSLAVYYSENEAFEVDVDNGVDCGYVIGENQLYAWRKAEEHEIIDILKFLYKNSFAYDSELKKVRKLKTGETLIFKEENRKIVDTSSLSIPSDATQSKPIQVGSGNVKSLCDKMVKEEEEKRANKLMKKLGKSKKSKGGAITIPLTTEHQRNEIYKQLGFDLW